MSLRDALPNYDTAELRAEWTAAFAELVRVGELDVPCAMGLGTRRLLFQTVRAMGAADVLDIGTYTGTSAAAFALAVGAHGRVVTVDKRDANACGGFWQTAGRNRTPAQLLAELNVADRVEFVTRDAREYLRTTERRFDFISIDGWHEPFAVYEEVSLSLARLKPNGLIFLDDVQPPGYEPLPGMDKIRGPWDALRQHEHEGSPFRVVQISQTLEGERVGVAFLLRDDSPRA